MPVSLKGKEFAELAKRREKESAVAACHLVSRPVLEKMKRKKKFALNYIASGETKSGAGGAGFLLMHINRHVTKSTDDAQYVSFSSPSVENENAKRPDFTLRTHRVGLPILLLRIGAVKL